MLFFGLSFNSIRINRVSMHCSINEIHLFPLWSKCNSGRNIIRIYFKMPRKSMWCHDERWRQPKNDRENDLVPVSSRGVVYFHIPPTTYHRLNFKYKLIVFARNLNSKCFQDFSQCLKDLKMSKNVDPFLKNVFIEKLGT